MENTKKDILDAENVCYICGTPLKPMTMNNPFPLTLDENVSCCDWCNENLVKPARIRRAQIAKEKEAEK